MTHQHASVLTVIDPDPNDDGDGHAAAVAGTIVLANGSEGAGRTDGTGQGVKPLPITHDGWIQPTVALAEAGAAPEGVQGWIGLLTDEQKNPAHHGPSGSVFDSLRLSKAAGGSLGLLCSASCLDTDEDYGIYEGMMADFTSHDVAICSTMGEANGTIVPAEGSSYYLVVPNNGEHEGSYGLNSQGQERSPGVSVCREQSVGACE